MAILITRKQKNLILIHHLDLLQSRNNLQPNNAIKRTLLIQYDDLIFKIHFEFPL